MLQQYSYEARVLVEKQKDQLCCCCMDGCVHVYGCIYECVIRSMLTLLNLRVPSSNHKVDKFTWSVCYDTAAVAHSNSLTQTTPRAVLECCPCTSDATWWNTSLFTHLEVYLFIFPRRLVCYQGKRDLCLVCYQGKNKNMAMSKYQHPTYSCSPLTCSDWNVGTYR